jgi:membrane protease YdiL (CAAX protease family)
MAKSKVKNRKSKIVSGSGAFATYWELSQRPLQAMVFLLPLIVLYELGTLWVAHDRVFNSARTLLETFFGWFGVTGRYLPGLIVVAVLLSWHVFRRDPWKLEPRVYGGMAVESVLLAVPLFVLIQILIRSPTPAMQPDAITGRWQSHLIFSIGAGIYEELVFRLILLALAHLILVDVLALPEHVGQGGAIAISALAFAFYHFPDWSVIPHEFSRFLIYAFAGVYLAGVYLLRGLGIAVGAHAVYDIFIVMQLIRAGELT